VIAQSPGAMRVQARFSFAGAFGFEAACHGA